MEFRSANMSDILTLKAMYAKIVDKMNADGINIWDDVYPTEFLAEDIENGRMYVLIANGGDIAAAFALCGESSGESRVKWSDQRAKALYIDRLGVSVDYSRRGFGGEILRRAIDVARAEKAAYLRLFVVDINSPALALYEKCGFSRAEGVYDEKIDEDLTLREYGCELKL